MASIRESDVVLSVELGQDKQWHVTTQEIPQPLASFDNPQSACAWALWSVQPKRGKVLVAGIPVVVG
jgi:hypothetical protein